MYFLCSLGLLLFLVALSTLGYLKKCYSSSFMIAWRARVSWKLIHLMGYIYP